MKAAGQWLALCGLGALAWQLGLLLHIAALAWLDAPSTTVQRSQIWRITAQHGQLPWRQEWRDLSGISRHLQRAVIAAEDDTFAQHPGLRWDAMRQAWQRNERLQAQAQRQGPTQGPGKLYGGSTITQQLAKNLLLSGERNLARKAQEAVLALALEAFLSKPRILELYLNHVEWGEGVFGAEAAARHYFRKSAAALEPWEAARLAVMLPRPRHFEQRPQSAYLAARADTIVARMGQVRWP